MAFFGSSTYFLPLTENNRLFRDPPLQMRYHVFVHRKQKVDALDERTLFLVGHADFRRVRAAADARHILFARKNMVALALKHLDQQSFDSLHAHAGRAAQD